MGCAGCQFMTPVLCHGFDILCLLLFCCCYAYCCYLHSHLHDLQERDHSFLILNPHSKTMITIIITIVVVVLPVAGDVPATLVMVVVILVAPVW